MNSSSYTERYEYSMDGFIACFTFVIAIFAAACVGGDMEDEPTIAPPAVLQPEGGAIEYYDDPYDCYQYECEPETT